MGKYNSKNDVIFSMNVLDSGVKIPNFDWIPKNREGLTIMEASSAVFAQSIEWGKTDVVTFCW